MKNPVYKLFLVLLIITLFLVGMHFFPKGISRIISQKFNLNREANVPAWYSTVLLFSVSLCSFGIYRLSHDISHSGRFWLFFGGVYCFLSMDEAASIHELSRNVLQVEWVFVYAPFAGAFFMACVCHLFRSENRSLRNWILGGLLVYAAGGLALESLYLTGQLSPWGKRVEIVVEEGLEMIGTIMVLTGCLRELNRLKARSEKLSCRVE